MLGYGPVMSMPTSRIASTATGLIWSAGSEPAERTSTLSPARWRSQPAAIWERPALWTQTNRTLGLLTLVAPVRRRSVVGVGRDDVVGGAAGGGVEDQEQSDADDGADEPGRRRTPGTERGAMPAKVSVKARPMVTAGLAKEWRR